MEDRACTWVPRANVTKSLHAYGTTVGAVLDSHQHSRQEQTTSASIAHTDTKNNSRVFLSASDRGRQLAPEVHPPNVVAHLVLFISAVFSVIIAQLTREIFTETGHRSIGEEYTPVPYNKSCDRIQFRGDDVRRSAVDVGMWMKCRLSASAGNAMGGGGGWGVVDKGCSWSWW